MDLITNNLDVWTSAQMSKSSVGRGNNGKQTAYGIKKLRELILELAVRGKLVPQDPNDEPASILLEKIADEKVRLIKEGKINRQQSAIEISDKEKPYVLPSTWEWARFPDVCDYKPGKTPSTKNPVYWSDNSDDIPWVSISDMDHFGRIIATNKKITQKAVDQVFKHEAIPVGSLLMSFKLTVGKIAILDVDAFHNEAIISIQPFNGISRDYLFNFLPTRALAGNTKRAIMGDTLNASSLSLLLIPIPPLAEQHRIVAKVDELMALCDQLEQQQTDSDAAHQILVETLLGTLTHSADQNEFATAWRRITEHFDTLFTTEHSIDQLKQTILLLAVMGKLLHQDSNNEKINLGAIRNNKTKKVVFADEQKANTPHELPSNWAWVLLGMVLSYKQGLQIGKGEQYLESGDTLVRYLRIIDFRHDDDMRFIKKTEQDVY